MTLRELKEAIARVPERDLDRELVIRARINLEEYAEDYPTIFFTFTERMGRGLSALRFPKAYLTPTDDPFLDEHFGEDDYTQYIFPNS